jgi:hypothetical protein
MSALRFEMPAVCASSAIKSDLRYVVLIVIQPLMSMTNQRQLGLLWRCAVVPAIKKMTFAGVLSVVLVKKAFFWHNQNIAGVICP